MDTDTRSKSDCCTAEDLVALIYDELSAGVRRRAEDHLAVCDPCTDEFAGLSLARLSVYEWNRDEFAVMETPLIEIPITPDPAASWVDALRGIFASPMRLAGAGVSFAAVLAAMALWAYMPAANDVAAVSQSPAVVEPGPDVVNTAEPSTAESPAGETVLPVDRTTEPERPAPIRKPSRNAQRPVRTVAERRQTPSRTVEDQRTNAPRLVEFEDEDDVTLRLGELLADVDTRK